MFLCTNPHQRFLSVTGLLALRPHLCESPLTLLQRKLISRATKGKDSMQSLLECALASPRITRLIAQEAGRIRTLDFRSCQHLSDAPLLNVLAACTQLQRFMVSYAPGTDNGKQITDESVLALAKHCPNLTEVVLQNCVNLTDNAVKYVTTQTHAVRLPVPLQCQQCCVSSKCAHPREPESEGRTRRTPPPHIVYATNTASQLTDALLPNLRACKSLKKLALDRRLRISRYGRVYVCVCAR